MAWCCKPALLPVGVAAQFVDVARDRVACAAW
jgi:hypothetical protein